MKPKIWITIVVVVIIGFIGARKVKRFLEIDSCLDHGGSWNYATETCDTTDDNEVQTTLTIGQLKFDPKYSFVDFKVETVDHSKTEFFDLNSNSEGKLYRTVLREAFEVDSSNFAGHYSFVFYGTGPSAERSKIIDRQSGQVYDGPESNHGYEFKVDSRMLITNPPDSLGFYDDCSYCRPAIYVLDEKSKTFEKLQ